MTCRSGNHIDRLPAVEGLGRRLDRPGLRGVLLPGNKGHATIGESEEAHAGGILGLRQGLGPSAVSERKERPRIFDPGTVIGNTDRLAEARIVDLFDRDLRGARAAGVLQKLVEDVADRGVEEASDFSDRLGRNLRMEGEVGGHGGAPEMIEPGWPWARRPGCMVDRKSTSARRRAAPGGQGGTLS